MSNPFATFRKNQKSWMAALVLLAILAFVIAPAIDTATSAFSSPGPGNQVVVRWNGGKLTLSGLQNYAQKHSILVRFLNALAREVIDAGGMPDVPGFFYDDQQNEILALGIQAVSDEGVLARSQLLADYAEQQGIAFSDEAIQGFFNDYCDGRISTPRATELLDETSGGRLSWYEVKEMLKQELSTLVAQQLARSGLFTIPPGKTYQDFRKLTRTTKLEAFPFYVDEYLDKVTGSPSEAELEAIYQAGAILPPNPNSPEPGFRRRYQANIQYIVANTQAWIDREKENLTEEQLRAEYDRRVELGQLQVPVEQETGPATDEENPELLVPTPSDANLDESSTSTPATSTSDPGTPLDSESTSPPTEGETAPQSEEQGPEEQGPNEQSGAAENAQSALDDASAEPSEAPLELPESGDQSQYRPVTNPEVRLVAFWQEAGDQEAPTGAEKAAENAQSDTEPAPPAQENPADLTPDAPAAGQEAPDATAPASTSDEISNDTSTTAATTEAAETDTLAPETTDSLTESEAGLAEQPAVEPEMRTQTFEEARESIADSLAADAARTAQQDALTNLKENVMEPYYSAYRQYEAFMDSGLDEDEEGNPRQPPARPDLKKLAEEAGFEFNETGLIDGVTLAQLPFGLGNVMPDESGLSGSVANVVMNPEFELFKPMESFYFDQAALQGGQMPEFMRYLFWKVEDRGAYIPDLEEIREEVVDAWKQQQAMQLTATAAGELVKKVNVNADDPWATGLSEAEKSLVIETSPFTWMTAAGGEPRLSSVPALRDAIGGDFMQRVFSTSEGQFVVAPNAGHSVYYACRVLEFSPSETELHDRFNADPLKSGPFAIARQESQMMLGGWFDNIEQQLGVEWQMNVGQFN